MNPEGHSGRQRPSDELWDELKTALPVNFCLLTHRRVGGGVDCGLQGQSMGGWGEGLHPSDVGTMETGMAVSPAPGTVPGIETLSINVC